MVNLFYLSNDVRKTARMMCDQHVSKIPTEIVQCAVEVIREVDSALHVRLMEFVKNAMSSGLKINFIKEKARGGKLRPLPRWMALCVGNYENALDRCAAMLDEARARFGKDRDLRIVVRWLRANLPAFGGTEWCKWLERANVGVDSKKRPYSAWFSEYGRVMSNGRTPFPQIMDDDDFPGCRTRLRPVEAARKHYIMKAGGAVNGVISKARMKQDMRYYHSDPPVWLVNSGAVLALSPKK